MPVQHLLCALRIGKCVLAHSVPMAVLEPHPTAGCPALLSLPAPQWLRKKGLSGADKKAGRIAAEGAVLRYIHPGSRLGVLLEVNCETDFVAASEKFQALVNELGMIIAATDSVVVNPEDVPAEVRRAQRSPL